MIEDDSERMPLDGETPFTTAERAAIRKQLREAAHLNWLWRRLRRLVLPMLATLGGGVVWLIDWIPKHYKP